MTKKVIILIIIFLFLFLTVCDTQKVEKPTVKQAFLLDTIVEVSAHGPKAEEAIVIAFKRIADIQDKMTSHGNDSEVLRINNAAGKKSVKVSQDTFYVIEKGLLYSEKTQGSFDITVGPLVKIWGIGTEDAKIPHKEQILKAIELVNFQDVKLDKKNTSVFLKKPEMALDLGGIAKGYAADETVRLLKGNGIKSALIDLGGNIYAIGHKPDGSKWKIGIQDPFKPRGNNLAILEISDKTIVTSGIYERFFEKNNKKYHHILDTSTGYPVENGLASVTIISNSSIDADAISTAVFAMGLKKGMAFIESLSVAEAIFVTNDCKVYVSSGIQNNDIRITNDRFTLENL